jgi:hypothetical protein
MYPSWTKNYTGDATSVIGKKEPKTSKLVDDFFSGALRYQNNQRIRKKTYEQALEEMLSVDSARPTIARREQAWYDEWNRSWAGSKHGDRNSSRPRPASLALPSAQGMPIGPCLRISQPLIPYYFCLRWQGSADAASSSATKCTTVSTPPVPPPPPKHCDQAEQPQSLPSRSLFFTIRPSCQGRQSPGAAPWPTATRESK